MTEKEYKTLDDCLDDSIYELHSICNLLKPEKKRQKIEHLKPIVFALVRTHKGKPKPQVIKALLDSGSDGTILFNNFAKGLKVKEEISQMWKMAAGNFTTGKQTKLQFKLPELHETRLMEVKVHLTDLKSNYDMIIGNDVLALLGLKLNYEDMSVEWEQNSIPMRSVECTKPISFAIEDSPAIADATERVKRILDAKYEPADLEQIVKGCKHLNSEEQHKLHLLLKEFEDLFDGTLGKWKTTDYHIDLKPNVVPFHARAFPVPKAYEATL
jgi:hypothetical protein